MRFSNTRRGRSSAFARQKIPSYQRHVVVSLEEVSRLVDAVKDELDNLVHLSHFGPRGLPVGRQAPSNLKIFRKTSIRSSMEAGRHSTLAIGGAACGLFPLDLKLVLRRGLAKVTSSTGERAFEGSTEKNVSSRVAHAQVTCTRNAWSSRRTSTTLCCAPSLQQLVAEVVVRRWRLRLSRCVGRRLRYRVALLISRFFWQTGAAADVC